MLLGYGGEDCGLGAVCTAGGPDLPMIGRDTRAPARQSTPSQVPQLTWLVQRGSGNLTSGRHTLLQCVKDPHDLNRHSIQTDLKPLDPIDPSES